LAVVAAVHFYGTRADQVELLDYLGEPTDASLHPWPLVQSPLLVFSRDEAMASPHVMVASRRFGEPAIIREGDAATTGGTRAALFNRMNLDRFRPRATEGIVDSNASPVLLWKPAGSNAEGLQAGDIGSQADSMSAISKDYELWATRVMNWVRRKGTKVWGLEQHDVRADLDIRRTTVSTVYALPGALAALEGGTPGH
jgi:hypothetical protein